MASFYTDNTTDNDMSQIHHRWAPSSPQELDKCNELFHDVAPEFDTKHPGYKDEAYKARRHEVTAVAARYKIGDPIPIITYTDEETALWKKVYTGLRALHPKYACKGYNDGINALEAEGLMHPDRVPCVADLSEFINSKTGFKLRPIGGYVEPRDFLAHLAFRYFPCTQYIRHHKNVEYSPDPDGIHDMVGHLPMFLYPDLADLTQEIGKISLGASDEVIKKLTSLYWFTVEVGLVKEPTGTKVYGAAILSSAAEMEFALSHRVPLRQFEPEEVCVRQFDPTNYQEVYYDTPSIGTAMDAVRAWGSKARSD